MSDENRTDQYVEHINSHILPFIDYDELQASYDTDMVYAKGILNRLHEAMVTVYGSEQLDEMDGDEGFVVVPGVIRGWESGNMCLALLELDLSSSGEHWGTSYLCKYGVIAQGGIEQDSALKSEIKEINAAYLPYDYGYTAIIPGDIHVDWDSLPNGIAIVLDDVRNHHAELAKNVLRDQEKAAPLSNTGVTIPNHVHGYEVKQAVCFSNDRGFALAESPRAPSPYVTWQFTDENGSGKREYYWGHYFTKAESAEKDYGKRVDEYRADYPTLTEKYNYLATAEMSTEQNYNMLDGQINNVAPRADLTDGQTYSEIKELAPETLPDERPSVTERLEAAKQAVKPPSQEKSAAHGPEL